MKLDSISIKVNELPENPKIELGEYNFDTVLGLLFFIVDNDLPIEASEMKKTHEYLPEIAIVREE